MSLWCLFLRSQGKEGSSLFQVILSVFTLGISDPNKSYLFNLICSFQYSNFKSVPTPPLTVLNGHQVPQSSKPLERGRLAPHLSLLRTERASCDTSTRPGWESEVWAVVRSTRGRSLQIFHSTTPVVDNKGILSLTADLYVPPLDP